MPFRHDRVAVEWSPLSPGQARLPHGSRVHVSSVIRALLHESTLCECSRAMKTGHKRPRHWGKRHIRFCCAISSGRSVPREPWPRGRWVHQGELLPTDCRTNATDCGIWCDTTLRRSFPFDKAKGCEQVKRSVRRALSTGMQRLQQNARCASLPTHFCVQVRHLPGQTRQVVAIRSSRRWSGGKVSGIRGVRSARLSVRSTRSFGSALGASPGHLGVSRARAA